MMLSNLFALLLLLLPVFADDCDPLYTRVFYNPEPAAELKVDMTVMFNTLAPCKDTYIHVKYLNSEDEFKCDSNLISIQGPNAPYLEQYVHSCQIEIDSAYQVNEFTYSVLPSGKDTSQTIELASDALPFRVVVLANVNMLDKQVYLPFAEAFSTLLDKREEELKRKEGEDYFRINGIVLNGGFAEELTGNKGENFNKIMRMISQYSAKWPLLINLAPSDFAVDQNFALIQSCFVLGGIGDGKDRTAMQGFSFGRKANVALIDTSSQYFSKDTTGTAEFNRTLAALNSFFASNQQNGNEFSIVFNHFPLFCNNEEAKDDTYSCQHGEVQQARLRDQLSSPKNPYPPADLFLSAFIDDYQRNYPYRNGKFMTLEQSRYNRGDFINLNEGTGGLAVANRAANSQKVFTAFRKRGIGFGLLTIKGNGELKKKNQSAVIEKQMTARKIYNQQNHALVSSVMDESYLKSEELNELDLFLLNYKHLAIESGQLVVEDVFRIVNNPQPAVEVANRHQLRPH